ncbi:MAG TPA: hypothetical protein VLA16_19015, partial [Ideonella sp.]|nr:hypothetical protein [Ideonella sp.]
MAHPLRPSAAPSRGRQWRTGRAGSALAAWLARLLLAAGLPAVAAPFAYITNQGSHDVSVIDLASQRVVATVPVGRSPAGVVAASGIGRVFVSNPDSKTI